MRRMVWIGALLLFSTYVLAQSIGPKDNTRLAKLYEIDQSDRGKKSADWERIIKLDREHRSEVQKLLKKGQVIDPPA